MGHSIVPTAFFRVLVVWIEAVGFLRGAYCSLEFRNHGDSISIYIEYDCILF